jgi:ribose transport system ATP-binding protein
MLKQAQTGSIVLFISHRCEEISQIADEMIVLRNGEIVGTMAHDEANGQRALTMMSGDEFTRLEAEDATLNATDEQKSGDHTHGMAIQVKDVKITSGGRPINLEFLQGEVTGLAGLDGHGQSSLLKLLGGILRPTSGVVECLVNGKQTTINNPHKAVHQRIVYVPRDRKTEGILPTLSVLENFSLATNPQRTRGGFISKSREVKDYQKYSRPLQIKVPSVDAPITALSGGNQQKVLIARWLAAEPEVILLDDPTRGVDGRTKSDLYALLTGLAREGKAIVLVSTEIEEFVSLCDRVIVMYQYGVSVDLRGPEISRSRIMSAMFRQEVE